MSWDIQTHVLVSFLWSFFCKRPVINVTLLTLKIAVHKIQDKYDIFKSINEII